ncbi:chromate transporter [Sporolactobacillus pectinivorans]|uniref:chromate transporter n=1 Tax=Sporolactobacillus pectinivorans TaxID=1591408 RepID=UPI000C25678A|nr:chromate transporter [Sporolactobacillus pectinivorans]
MNNKNREAGKTLPARYTDILIAFSRSSVLSFGGGPSGIPMIETEVVKRYHWMTIEEFGDMVAIANALPGPVNTKLAGYVGWRVRGIGGMLAALVACVLPMVIAMIVLLGFLTAFQNQRWVRGMTQAVLPVVGVLMAQLTWSFLYSAKKGLGWVVSLLLVGLSFILMQLLHVQAPILIALTLLFVLLKRWKRKQTSAGEHK